MLSLYETKYGGRREFLKIGSLGLGGLTLSHLFQAQAAAAPRHGFLKDRAVVFLFCHGGPSQIETFDPKMTAPSEIRSALFVPLLPATAIMTSSRSSVTTL